MEKDILERERTEEELVRQGELMAEEKGAGKWLHLPGWLAIVGDTACGGGGGGRGGSSGADGTVSVTW